MKYLLVGLIINWQICEGINGEGGGGGLNVHSTCLLSIQQNYLKCLYNINIE